MTTPVKRKFEDGPGFANFNSVELGDPAGCQAIASVTKSMQKKSTYFKVAWATYCNLNAGGILDPSRHSEAFQQEFYAWLAEAACMAEMQSQTGSESGGGWSGDWSGGTGQEPQMPQMSEEDQLWNSMMEAINGLGGKSGMGGKGGMGGFGGIDNGMDTAATKLEHQNICIRIKAFQRLGPEQKEAWKIACASVAGNRQDPARHDIAFLRQFAKSHQLPALPDRPQPMAQQPMAQPTLQQPTAQHFGYTDGCGGQPNPSEWGGKGAGGANNQSNDSWIDDETAKSTIFLGGLPEGLSEEEVANNFSQVGTVKQVKFLKAKGTGLVVYDTPIEARIAIETFNGLDCGGTRLQVRNWKSM